jgi:hypothetical protein
MSRDKIVTPSTDPDRWTAEEKGLFDRGLCSWVVESGNWGGVKHCRKRSKRGASFGNCREHEREMLEDYYPDGSPRHR